MRKIWSCIAGMVLVVLISAGVYLSSGREQITAIVNVNLIPMTDEGFLADQTVLIQGDVIADIGPAGEIRVPRNARVIEGSGFYLLPGLADMHMHTREDWEDAGIWPVQPLKLYLANGVTTVRDFAPTGSRLNYALDWNAEIQAGLREGPQIFTSGRMLSTSPLDDPEGIVKRNVDLGFDFIKFYSYLSEEDFQRGMRQAKQLGIYTAGHIPFAVGLDRALEAGMNEIAHVEELIFEFIDFDRQQDLSPDEWWEEVISGAVRTFDIEHQDFLMEFFGENQYLLDSISLKLVEAGAPVDTTMVVDRVVLQKIFMKDVFLAKPENRFQEKGYIDDFLAGDEKHLNQCRGVEPFCDAKAEIDSWIFQGLYENGVLLVLGTDAGTGGMGIVPGFSVHEELGILVENGLTPYQALQCATVNAGIVAAGMGREGDFGTVEVGKRADLILVDGNPLIDLSTLMAPVGVMAGGEWYSRERLDNFLEIRESNPIYIGE